MKNLKKVLAIALAFCLIGALMPCAMASEETLQAPVVCTWANNKTAAVSITIDDGVYESAGRYNDLQKKYGVKSTQFMIPGRLENAGSSVINGWKKIFSEGYMDLGNHSYNHKLKYNNTDKYTAADLAHDVTDAHKKLETLFKGNKVLSYATPWGQTPENAVAEIQKKHYANRNASGGVLAKSTPTSFFQIPAVAVKFGTTATKLNEYVDSAVTKNGWYVALLHGIGPDGSDDGAYLSKYETIEEHFAYIKAQSDKGNVWSGSFNDVVKYIYERNSAKTEVDSSGEKVMKITLTDDMEDNTIFNYPLTLKVNVSKRWPEKATLLQDKKKSEVAVKEENGKKYVFLNIVPDSGTVELSVDTLLEIEEEEVAPLETPEEEDGIKILIDGEKLICDQPPVIVEGRTLVPMRAIFEKLGAVVSWEGETQTASGDKEGKIVSFVIGESFIGINGEKKPLDVPAQIISGRTMIPARAVAEAFGCTVSWNGETQTVIITK